MFTETQKDLHFPNVNYKNIEKLTTLIYKNKISHPHESLKLKDILAKGYSITTVSCSKTIAADLGLMRDSRDIYILTDEGNEFAKSVLFENKNAIKSLGEKQIITFKKSLVLFYMYQELKENPSLSGRELGIKVRDKFNKNEQWTNETCKNIGNSGVSILSGFQLFSPQKKEKINKKINPIKITNKLHPRLSIESIQKYILKFYDNEPVSFYSALKGKKVSNTINNDLNLLIKLNLITNYDSNRHILTKEGLVYRRSLREKNDQETFQVILSNLNHMKFIISKLDEYGNDNIGYAILGKILSEYNDIEYSSGSIKLYGSNLLGWLKYANIIQKINGRNILNSKFKEGNNKTNEVKVEKIKKIDEYNDFHSLFDALTKNYCDLFYSVAFINSNKWALTNLKKDDILDIYNKLVDTSDTSQDINKIIFNNAKLWFEEAYETSNKKYLKRSYDLISEIQKVVTNGGMR